MEPFRLIVPMRVNDGTEMLAKQCLLLLLLHRLSLLEPLRRGRLLDLERAQGLESPFFAWELQRPGDYLSGFAGGGRLLRVSGPQEAGTCLQKPRTYRTRGLVAETKRNSCPFRKPLECCGRYGGRMTIPATRGWTVSPGLRFCAIWSRGKGNGRKCERGSGR